MIDKGCSGKRPEKNEDDSWVRGLESEEEIACAPGSHSWAFLPSRSRVASCCEGARDLTKHRSDESRRNERRVAFHD